jgi:uncharacterized low-complexity protein
VLQRVPRGSSAQAAAAWAQVSVFADFGGAGVGRCGEGAIGFDGRVGASGKPSTGRSGSTGARTATGVGGRSGIVGARTARKKKALLTPAIATPIATKTTTTGLDDGTTGSGSGDGSA